MAAASDEHGRVRLEAITAASWLPEEVGLPIVETAAKKPLESSMKSSHRHALAKLKNEIIHDSPISCSTQSSKEMPKRFLDKVLKYTTAKAIAPPATSKTARDSFTPASRH